MTAKVQVSTADRTFAFEDTKAAFAHLKGASHFGKVVIAMAH